MSFSEFAFYLTLNLVEGDLISIIGTLYGYYKTFLSQKITIPRLLKYQCTEKIYCSRNSKEENGFFTVDPLKLRKTNEGYNVVLKWPPDEQGIK